MVEIETAAFAATWRDEDSGEILGYTLGDTMCRSPRRPWAMTGTDDEWQFPLPCGQCEGCLERIRRNLADRLNRKYGTATCAQAGSTSSAATRDASAGVTSSTTLWLIRIWAPADLHYYFSRKLHRWRGVELESGTYRLGVRSFAVLARSRLTLLPRLRRLGLRYHIEPVRLGRGRRAWRRLTSGILVARAVYGKETKRWYARGLPPAERMRWDVVKKAMQKPWRRRTGARVRTGGKIILVPPAIWSMDSDRMKEYRATAATASSPEEVEGNKRWLLDLVAGVAKHSNLEAPAQPAPKQQVSREFYIEMAKRKHAGASATAAPVSDPSTLLGGGLRSSVHSGNAPPAAIPPDEELAKLTRIGIGLLLSRIEDKGEREELHKRWQRLNFALELKEWTARMQSKIRGG